jgi:cystathionine beta-lyase/cystathionine gamma-synthase
MADYSKMKFGTKVLHAGIEPEPVTGAIMTPIFQTSTYVQESPGKHKGYEYARTQNPTRTVLQDNLAALENGKAAVCFGSGMAAVDAVCKMLKPGDEVVATSDLYGGTYRIFTKIFANYGITFKFANLSNAEDLSPLLSPKTKMVWLETPTNPMLQILDLKKLIGIAKANGSLVCVDNTFASPYLQNPLDFGADLVMHSITKYIAGHSDVVMGCVITKDDALAEQLYFIQNACGAVPGPQDCFLVLRGIKTLHIRMDRACSNAMKIAEWLSKHPKVDKVLYPGLPNHPGHEIAKQQMRNFGGMISFMLKGDNMEEATRTMERFKLFSLGESLGGVESLVTHPAGMTHAGLPKEERLKNGLKDTLMRLSVGIEDVDDLIADIEQAIG